MGVNGVVLVLWMVASVLAVGCWNVVKFVVTRLSEYTVITQPAPLLDTAPRAQRPSVDAL